MGLQILIGGKVTDNMHVFGMSYPAAYACIDDFALALNTGPELSIRMPSTVEKWQAINAPSVRRAHME